MGALSDGGERLRRYRMKADEMTGVMLSNPKGRRINELEKEIAQLRAIQGHT